MADMAVSETHSNIFQTEGTIPGWPVILFKGRAATQAGGMVRQEPYETQQGEI